MEGRPGVATHKQHGMQGKAEHVQVMHKV
jgi:hypothetical protein